MQTQTYTPSDPRHRHTQRGHACTHAVWVGSLQSVTVRPHGRSGSRIEPQAWQGRDCTHCTCACSLDMHRISQVHVGEPSGRRGHVCASEHPAQQPPFSGTRRLSGAF
ncbi:unnamed protein product [Rangifer tarandus platyrhynchus]|uniref:Uncharacterized protein n=2 Tax=Rangifer tarandus platyrhynchus TaxID=3082113 RepID=A0ABN8ZLN8_RANTA|nr:unnamed protein product [Rangifer tarandus platyrhynchus]